MSNDAGFKAMNAIHRTMIKISGGHLGWSAGDMPVLELTTTGRKSGQPRSVMLTSPIRQGADLVVVASRGGDDNPPAWLLNLRANPIVQVGVQGGPKRRMLAMVASAAERDRLWPLIVADHKNYAGYQAKTAREIALVILRPVG